jgi:hypothetical protein
MPLLEIGPVCAAASLRIIEADISPANAVAKLETIVGRAQRASQSLCTWRACRADLDLTLVNIERRGWRLCPDADAATVHARYNLSTEVTGL